MVRGLGLRQMVEAGWGIEEAAWSYLQETLNAALVDFHVRLEVKARTVTLGEPDVTTYEATALQLFNDVAAKTPYAHCANEKCGRLFVRQSGRAKYGQHRYVGVKYCSDSCANAQKQRDYRRR